MSASCHDGYFHDRSEAAAVGLHHEVAGVERAQRPPVADAERGRPGEALSQQPIEAGLRRLVRRRGRFVEEEPVGLLGEGTLEAQEPFHHGAPFPYLFHPGGGVWGATGLRPSGHSAIYG